MAQSESITIRAEDLRNAFDALISGSRTREETSDWAESLRLADDRGNLHFEPSSAEQQPWSAIVYLGGIDLKDSPSSYLHVTKDF